MDNLEIKKFLSGPKIVFLILGIIILGELVYAARVLTSPASTPPLPAEKFTSQKTVGRISLNTTKANFRVSEVVPVSVIVNTGGHEVSGVDLIVSFDPLVLEATPGGLVKGKIFSEYPLMSVDARKGVIAVSGISSLQSGFKGTGQFAIINLRAKRAGKTALTIDFKKNTSTNSNLVEAGTIKNVLDTVDNLEVKIR